MFDLGKAGLGGNEVMEGSSDGAALAPDLSPEEVLTLRAKALSAAPESGKRAGDQVPVVLFQLAHETYAVETGLVSEVFPLEHLAPVPCTPSFVMGVVLVRSRVVSVVDLRRFFGLPVKGLTNLNRVIVLSDGRMEFGILADRILSASTVDRDSVQIPPATLSDAGREYVQGIVPGRGDGKPVVLLDARKLLRSKRIVVKENVGSR